MKSKIFRCIYIVGVLAYSIYVLLDTFVITHVYSSVSSSSSSSSSSSTSASTVSATTAVSTGTVVSTSTYYKDDNIEITIKEYTVDNTEVYVADVQVNDSSYLKTVFANNSYGKNVTAYTSTTASSVSALLAINGDYYGAQESGYVLKNGVIYRSTSDGGEDLVIYKDGSWKIINEDDISCEQLLEDGAYNILSFGPALVENGSVSVTTSEEVGKAMESNPRTAIGIISENHYVFVVSDGRTDESEGLTLYELAEFMKGLGCTTAYNLDGGGSSTMYFNGEVINNPTTTGTTIAERKVSDIVYVGY